MCPLYTCVPTAADRFGSVSGRCCGIYRQIFPVDGVNTVGKRCFRQGRGFVRNVDRERRRRMETGYQDISPCRHCVRVPDPQNCENKNCKSWQQWFLRRWDRIRALPRRQVDAARLRPAGINVGGRYYTLPHQVRDYIRDDPCEGCVCPREVCDTPCRVRKAWEKTCSEVLS